MPNRILKESICCSDTLRELSWFEYALFTKLIVLADDYGIYDGRVPLIRARAFSMDLDRVDEGDVAEALRSLERAGLIVRYAAGGKPYLRLVGWDEHQNVRAKRSKYPMEGEETAPRREKSEERTDVCDAPLRQGEAVTPPPTGEVQDGDGEYAFYGEYGNVRFSRAQFEALVNEFPDDWKERVQAVSEYCAAHGRKYKNYLAVIRSWSRKNKARDRGGGSFDKDEFFQAALRRSQKLLADGGEGAPKRKEKREEKEN